MDVNRIYHEINQISLKSSRLFVCENETQERKLISAIKAKILLINHLTGGDLTEYVCEALKTFKPEFFAGCLKLGSLEINSSLDTFTIGFYDLEEIPDRGQLIHDNNFNRETQGEFLN